MCYKVIPNNCRCHPETCCCQDWHIINENGEKIASGMDKKALNDIINLANLEWFELGKACLELPVVGEKYLWDDGGKMTMTITEIKTHKGKTMDGYRIFYWEKYIGTNNEPYSHQDRMSFRNWKANIEAGFIKKVNVK